MSFTNKQLYVVFDKDCNTLGVFSDIVLAKLSGSKITDSTFFILEYQLNEECTYTERLVYNSC